MAEDLIEVLLAGLLRDAADKDLLGPLVILATTHASLGPRTPCIAGLCVQLRG